MPNLPEWLLARLATPDRAAAILGDLTEISQTRGRLWFAAAYFRTIISLGWRAPVALLVAIVSMKIMFRAAIPWIARALPWQLNSPGLIGEHNLRLSHDLWNFAMISAQCLIFVLPFALVRFGARSRVTILAAILLLAALPVYTADALVRDLSGALTLLAVAAALAIPIWRGPLAIVAATCATACATAIGAFFACTLFTEGVLRHNVYFLPAGKKVACTYLAIFAAVVVCSALNQRLMRARSAVA